METTMNNDMCRCCATVGTFKDIKTKYHWMGEEEIYADMLKDYLDITLAAVDGESNGICEVCITQLRNAANFKKQVQHTEQRFQRHLQDKIFAQNIVKEEASGDEDVDSDNMGDDFVPDYDVSIKSETEDKPKKRTTRASTSKNKIITLDGGESSKKRTIPIPVKKNGGSKLRSELQAEMKKHRSNLKEILNMSNATPLRCRSSIYACCFCEKQFPNPANLKLHSYEHKEELKGKLLQRIMLDITGLQCTACDKKLNLLEDLMDHLKNDHKRKIYTDIKNQILQFKFEGKLLKCCLCVLEFHRFKLLIEHMSYHYRNFVCNTCDAGFATRTKLYYHEQVHKVGKFTCAYCSKEFDTNIKKRLHERCVHIFSHYTKKCGCCNERFKTEKTKFVHMHSVHGFEVPEFNCSACNKTFNNQRSLNLHTRKEHLLERRFECDSCDMKFFRSSELKIHSVKHTGEKEFTCDVCLKSYGRKKTLREHMRIHANDRRFKCDICGQAFVQKCSWRGHMRTKHNENV